MFVTTKRIVKSGFNNFYRNGFVSLASILVMVVALFVIGSSLIFLRQVLNTSLQLIRDKVDINVYFVPGTSETDIIALKTQVQTLPEVESASYESQAQVLIDFKERHADDPSTLQALDEIDSNPLSATLNIRASDPSQYQTIADFFKGSNLNNDSGEQIVSRVNYNENKEAINKLSHIINSVDLFGAILSIILVVLSILITFNTIRLAIYTSREEIGVMRLVGASTSYIRGPFIMSGIIYGVVSSIVTLILFYPITYWLGKETADFFVGFSVFSYYLSHVVSISLLIIGAGIVIGAVSSFFAVAKYLKR